MQVPRPRGVLSWTSSFVMALVVLVAACAPPPPPPPPPDGGGSLGGGTFLSTSVTDFGWPRQLVPPWTRIEISFSPGRSGPQWSATAGCDRFGGLGQASGGRLLLQVQTTTERSCSPAQDAQDAWLKWFLAAGPTYSLEGPRLRLQVGWTVVDMLDKTEFRELTTTDWQLESIVGQFGVQPLPPGTAAKITFPATETDRLIAFDVEGCNVGSGTAVIGPGSIEIGPLQRTLRPCEPGAAQVEAAIVGVLAGTITYDIDGDVLRLTHPSWRGLVLRALPEPPSPPLMGTEWHLRSLIDGTGQPLAEGLGATLTIAPPTGPEVPPYGYQTTMTVQVEDCNRGSSDVDVGSGILLGPFSWTEMACQPGPAELEAYIQHVLSGLLLPGYTKPFVSYEIEGQDLVVRLPESSDGLVFRAAP